jgi:outer membrane lipoprotein
MNVCAMFEKARTVLSPYALVSFEAESEYMPGMGMKHGKVFFFMVLGVYFVFMAGCSGVQVVPKDMEDRVNHDISFVQLLENPLPYKGQILVVGGQILSAKRLENATQIEVLQLPLNRNMEPVESLQKSKGRFLALQENFLDPATLPLGTRVTMVGEVSGMVTLPLDETTYDFPTLVIKSLTVWPPISTYRVLRPYPYGYPYWGPYWGPYGGPYWWL